MWAAFHHSFFSTTFSGYLKDYIVAHLENDFTKIHINNIAVNQSICLELHIPFRFNTILALKYIDLTALNFVIGRRNSIPVKNVIRYYIKPGVSTLLHRRPAVEVSQ